MTLLFTDGFDHYNSADFAKKGWSVTNGSPTINASGGRFAAGCANLYYLDELTYYINTGGKRYTIGFAVKFNTMPNSALRYFFRAYNDTGGSYMHIWVSNDTHIEIWNNTVPGEIYNSGTGFYTSGKWYYVEVQIEFYNGASGFIGVKWDNVTLLSRTADNVWTGGSVLQFFRIIGTSYGSGIDIDDVYILSEDGSINNDYLGESRVDTLWVSGSGNYSQMSPSAGNNEDCVDETQQNGDSDYVTGDAEGEIDTYSYDDLSEEVENEIIRGISINTAAVRTDTYGVGLTPKLRINSTDYDQSEETLTDAYVIYQTVVELNPDDSEEWAFADINALESGMEVTYLESTAYARITQQVIEILRTFSASSLINICIIT